MKPGDESGHWTLRPKGVELAEGSHEQVQPDEEEPLICGHESTTVLAIAPRSACRRRVGVSSDTGHWKDVVIVPSQSANDVSVAQAIETGTPGREPVRRDTERRSKALRLRMFAGCRAKLRIAT